MDTSYKRSTFVTLTFNEPPNNQAAYAALKRFLQRVREWFPEASAVWRKEPQERGAIHFHLIFFNLPYWPQFHLQDTWTECTDEVLSIAHIKLIRKFSTYVSYISKYIAKAETSPASPSLVIDSYQQKPTPRISGRCWGYFNKKALPLAPLVKIIINEEELGRYAQWSCLAMSRGRCGDSLYSRKSYTPEAAQMLHFCLITAETFFTDEHEAAEAAKAQRQWFGGTAVISSASVPLSSVAPP